MTIDEALGFAMGVLHMSYDDFCVLTPTEFGAVCEAHNKQMEALMHADWERMRMHACITIQPHTKKKLTPKQLINFAWERKAKTETPLPGKEEQLERLHKLLERREKASR